MAPMSDPATPHGRAGDAMRPARSPRRADSMLLHGAGVRLAGALVLVAGLWLAVLWALA
jgi:hypothetical protein